MAMRPYQLNVPIIRALKARMESAALETALAAIRVDEPKYASKLVAPARVFEYAPPTSLITAFPVIGFTDVDGRLTDDTGFDVTGDYDVGIIVYLNDPDPEVLALALRLYLGAIVRVALEGRILGTGSADGAWGTVAKRVIPGPGILTDEDPAVRARHGYFAWSTFVLGARRGELD